MSFPQPAIRCAVRPWFDLGLGITSGLIGLAAFGVGVQALLTGGDGGAPSVGVGLFCLLFAGFILRDVRERFGWLEVGQSIRMRRMGRTSEFPLRAARAIVISRPVRRLREPTAYSIQLELEGERRLLLFAEHYLHGAAALQKARTLAQRLEVPILDPDGELRRQSRFRLERWLGQGEEYKIVLLVVAVVLGVGLGVVLLRGG